MIWLLLAAMAQVKMPPPITKEQGRTASTQDLVARYLLREHGQIDSSEVHPHGMDANFPYVSSIDFFEVPRLDGSTCRRRVFLVEFKPIGKLPTTINLPALPVLTVVRPEVRLADQSNDGTKLCRADKDNRYLDSGRPSTSEAIKFLQAFKIFAVAPPRDLRVEVRDPYRREVQKFGRRERPIGSGRDALRKFPLTGVYAVKFDPSEEFDDFSLARRFPRRVGYSWVQVGATVGAEAWDADVALWKEKPIAISITRRSIPPF